MQIAETEEKKEQQILTLTRGKKKKEDVKKRREKTEVFESENSRIYSMIDDKMLQNCIIERIRRITVLPFCEYLICYSTIHR